MAPLSVGALVFGLALGAVIATSALHDWVGASSSLIINAGAAQLALVDLIDRGAPWVVVVGTALIVNARFALYSAGLAQVYRAFPMRWRVALAFMLTDQAAAFQKHFTPLIPDPVRRRWFFLGGAGLFVIFAVAGTVVGIMLGPIIPASWQIGFIVPLMFLAMVLRTVSDRPGVIATIVAAAVVVLARDLPGGINVLVGTVAAIAVTRTVVPAGWYRGAPTGEEDEPREGAP
jgi:predicted branched-subunit amino acid permease